MWGNLGNVLAYFCGIRGGSPEWIDSGKEWDGSAKSWKVLVLVSESGGVCVLRLGISTEPGGRTWEGWFHGGIYTLARIFWPFPLALQAPGVFLRSTCFFLFTVVLKVGPSLFIN